MRPSTAPGPPPIVSRDLVSTTPGQVLCWGREKMAIAQAKGSHTPFSPEKTVPGARKRIIRSKKIDGLIQM